MYSTVQCTHKLHVYKGGGWGPASRHTASWSKDSEASTPIVKTVKRKNVTRAITMPDIEKSLFSGQENISNAEWATLTVPDMSDANVSEFLEGGGWDGNVAGVVGLQLATDNSRPTAARFALAGRWSDRPNRIQAQKIFAEAPADWLLEINLPNMGLFHFADGNMVSEYVGGDALECQFYTVVEGEKVSVDDELLGEKGINYFRLGLTRGPLSP